MCRFKKIFVGSIVSVLMFTLAVPPASAQSAATVELQAQIAILMAQIAALNGGNSTPIGNPAPAQYVSGDKIITTATVRVRTGGSLIAQQLGRQAAGSVGIVTSGPITAGGHTWYRINFDTGVDGWVASSWLARSATSGSQATVKIISPNGGEKIDPARPLSPNYVATGISSISVALYKNDMWKAWIVKDLNIQSEVDFIPNKILQGLGEGDNKGDIFKMYITGQKSDGSGYVEDKSDAAFTFVATGTVPPIAKPTPRFNGLGGMTTDTITVSAVFGKPAGGPTAVTGTVRVGTINWGNGVTAPVSTLVTGNQMTVPLKHTYTRTGTYTITLTDLSGKSMSEKVDVVVTPAASTATSSGQVRGASTTVSSEIYTILQTISSMLKSLQSN